jgi:hypothetical protein
MPLKSSFTSSELRSLPDGSNGIDCIGSPNLARTYVHCFWHENEVFSIANKLPARTGSEKMSQWIQEIRRSSDACDFDAWQVTTIAQKGDGHVEARSGLSLDKDARCGTWRATRPSGAWLEARIAASGALTTVDFIRRSADESRVRTMCVIPEEKKGQLALKRSFCQRHDGQYPHRAVFQGSNEALDDCDAAALADSTAAMADIVLATPELEAGTSKLSAAVGNQMLGSGALGAMLSRLICSLVACAKPPRKHVTYREPRIWPPLAAQAWQGVH